MACAERVETKTKVWAWCSGWLGIPYPCRKTKTELWYQYEFHQTRNVPSWFPFWEIKEGCCENIVYEWRKFVLWNSPKPTGWINHDVPVIKLFRNKLESNGACQPIGAGEVVIN